MNYRWRFVTVQETGIKTIPKKKKFKKIKMTDEALQIAVKTREVKSKGEKERYTHLNAEFQRIARRERKPSLSINAKKQRKTIEWERLEISSRKLEISREHFMQKMGSVKDRNGKYLTEAGDIKRRWQEDTEELYKKDLHDLDNHDGVITQLEPDILECEVKWALGSITMNKASDAS